MTSDNMRNNRTLLAAIIIWCAGLAGCVYPHTRPLQRTPPDRAAFDVTTPGRQAVRVPQYYFPVIGLGPKNGNDPLVLLAFSGGGTRAAALAYGVLDELRRIGIRCTGPGTCDRTLLDEVDVISSTSGGARRGHALRRRH
jgi:predicted acylesterase/phospholipase RssA